MDDLVHQPGKLGVEPVGDEAHGGGADGEHTDEGDEGGLDVLPDVAVRVQDGALAHGE